MFVFLFCNHSLCNYFPAPTPLLDSLPSLCPVHCAALLRARAEDVPRLQHFRFVSLHAAARAPDGCCRTGLLFQPAGTSAGQKHVRVILHPSLKLQCWFTLIHKYFRTVVTFPICSSPLRISCGLFEGGETVFNVTEKCVNHLPSLAKTTLHYLTSEAFALPLILAEM